MRILYVNHTKKISGAGLSLSTLIKYLPANIARYFWLPAGSEIDAKLGATPENTFHDRYLCQFMTTLYGDGYTLSLYIWHILKGIAAVPRLRSRIKKWKINLIHINETTLLAYAFAASLYNIPFVLHARTALKKRPIETFLLRRLAALRRFCIIAIDEEVKKSFPSECQRFIDVIYNPIEIGPSPSLSETEKLRKEWGIFPTDIVVGQVASLHSAKGIWMILEIAEKLCASTSNVRFVLVGDFSAEAGEGPKLKQAILDKGLETRIILPGYHTNLPLVYSSIDIALCLFGEGLGGVGRTAYEAALCGKALVATIPEPDNSQTLQNRKTGLLFTPEDRAGIENGIQLLIKDAAYRTQLGECAKKTIGERHDPRMIAGQVLAVYTRLLA
ncbi:MAG: glycosyltransferase family 4 protein [Chthoniobacterales bacterium]